MERKIINKTISVSGQINIDDVTQLQNEGVKTIICNRPDHEDPGQLEVDKVKVAVESAGLNFYFMPVVSGQMNEAQGEQFSRILDEAPKPIHAYCRSGTRCSILWAMSELLAGKDKDKVLKTTAQAGYDLSKMFA